MSCNKFNRYLKGEIDQTAFQAHIKECDSCRSAYEIDTRIMDKSKSLNDDLIIPDLWPSIEGEILQTEAKPGRFHFRKNLYLAVAATFLILSSLWFFNLLNNESSADRILSHSALEKVKVAENDYLSAIEDLEEIAYQKLDRGTKPLNQLYRNKLALIDQQIRSCQEALENNPANSHIRRYLLAALQDKHKALEDILQLSIEKGEQS